MTKFILDSGDADEYKKLLDLAKSSDFQLWGATTNPSLIAKKLNGTKATQAEAFSVLQKQIVEEILKLVPGSVSAEVYAAKDTTAQEMINQGELIATWDSRVAVKIPTTIESFKARTELRKLGIHINNTLVFSQRQVFAITLHEQIMTNLFGLPKTDYPCFISPFIGRLDDVGENGLSMLEHSVKMLNENFPKNTVWMLEASVRNLQHLKKGIDINVDLITAPLNVYSKWLTISSVEKQNINFDSQLKEIPNWQIPQELLSIKTIEDFMQVLENNTLDISHPLTTKGIEKFAADWATIIN